MCVFECGEGECRNREMCTRDLKMQIRMETYLLQQPIREPSNVSLGETFDPDDEYPVIMRGSSCGEH